MFHNTTVAKWEKHKILLPGYDVKHIRFINYKTGFLFCTYKSRDLSLNPDIMEHKRQQEAIIFKTIDGGINWTIVYKDKGELIPICVNSELGFVTKIEYVGENASPKSLLLKSTDSGATWLEIGELPILAFNGGDYKPNSLVLWGSQQLKQCSYKAIFSIDYGKTWQDIEFSNPPDSLPKPVLNQNGRMWYFSGNSLVMKDLHTQTEHIEKIFNNIKKIVMSIDENQNLWFIGSSDNILKLYKRMHDGEILSTLTPITKDSFFPDYLHVFDNSIIIWGKEIVETNLIPKYRMYYSQDKGKTWAEEKIPNSLHANPVAFYGKDSVWAIGLNGVIQIRKERM